MSNSTPPAPQGGPEPAPDAEGGRALMRIKGVPVYVPPSGMIGVGLIAWLWAPVFGGESQTQQVLMALAFALLLYVSILGHEVAHAAMARRFGFPVERIVLWILGGFTVYQRRESSPGREASIALAGPIATLAAAAAFKGGEIAVAPISPSVGALCWTLALANLLMAVYNLLPGTPLDGGTVLKAAVWQATGSESRGSVAAAWGGRVLAALILATPFVASAVTGRSPSLWNVAIATMFAFMLWRGASDSLMRARVEQRSADMTASALARRAVPVDAKVSLAEGLRRAREAGAGAIVVVDHDGKPLGIVSEAAIKATPEQRQPWIDVATVSKRLEDGSVISRDLGGLDLIRHIASNPAGEYLVLDGQGRVFGVIATSDVEALLNSR